MIVSHFALLILSLVSIRSAWAQEEFAPPPPPPLESELDDFDDDIPEMEGDVGFAPPTPPPPAPPGGNPSPIQGSTAGVPGPPPAQPMDFRTSNNAFIGRGKFRFEIVDGEFYEKGKKRGRGKKIKPRP